MFNRVKRGFNRLPFNRIVPEDEPIEITASIKCASWLDCLAGSKIILQARPNCLTKLYDTCKMYYNLPMENVNVYGELDCNVKLYPKIYANVICNGVITVSCYVSKLIYAVNNLANSLNNSIWLGVTIGTFPRADNTLECDMWLGCTISDLPQLFEHLDEYCSSYGVEIKHIHADVTLHPGDVLIIDSSNFTARLNGLNVLHLIDGEWLFINPNTIRLEYENGGKVEMDEVTEWDEVFI